MSNDIYILGDICPQWGWPSIFDQEDSCCLFHDIVPMLQNAAFVVANLEAPITLSSSKLEKNSINLKANPKSVQLIKNAGVDALALANNHILDYGIEGLNDTLTILQRQGIQSFGVCGSDFQRVVYYTRVAGRKIAFIAFAEHEFNAAEDYGEGAFLWNDLYSPKLIYETRLMCDFLVVLYHGGIEEYRNPSPRLQKRCRAMIDAGADFVTCQHSHCIGTRECWHGGEILYGQGNSIFGYQKENNEWNEGLIVRISFNERKHQISYLPIEAREDGEYLMDAEHSEILLKRFEKESLCISSDEYVLVKWKEFCMKSKDAYLPMLFAHGRYWNKMNRLLGGALVRCFTTRNTRRNSMNLIRCDSHREVLQTILEDDYYNEQK